MLLLLRLVLIINCAICWVPTRGPVVESELRLLLLREIPPALDRLRREMKRALSVRDYQSVGSLVLGLSELVTALRDVGLLNEESSKELDTLIGLVEAVKADLRYKRWALPQTLNDSFLFEALPRPLSNRSRSTSNRRVEVTELPLISLVQSVSDNVKKLHDIILFLLITLSFALVSYTALLVIKHCTNKNAKRRFSGSEICVCPAEKSTKTGQMEFDEEDGMLFRKGCNKSPEFTDSERRLDLSLDEMSDRLYILENQARDLYHLCVGSEFAKNNTNNRNDEEAQQL